MTCGRILVIRLGALGDVVLSCGPFQAIRRYHKGSQITLLTTQPYVDFLKSSEWFDEIIVDQRPSFWQIKKWIRLRKILRAGHFDRIYDLQTSDRSGWYYKLLGPGNRPEWSGIVSGCSHPHINPDRDELHTIDRQRDQLAAAGISNISIPDFSWVNSDLGRFNLPKRYYLIVPGGAAHRPLKRWPAKNFAAIARNIVTRGVTPVLIGGVTEREAADSILSVCENILDLTGLTSLADLAVLARHSCGAVGNDTGPMHIIAAAGCPCLVLFSSQSDHTITAPRGQNVEIMFSRDLANLLPEKVERKLSIR